jgi:hypothetical protein
MSLSAINVENRWQTVELDAVQGELLSAVHHAFQSAHVSIWSADGR